MLPWLPLLLLTTSDYHVSGKWTSTLIALSLFLSVSMCCLSFCYVVLLNIKELLVYSFTIQFYTADDFFFVHHPLCHPGIRMWLNSRYGGPEKGHWVGVLPISQAMESLDIIDSSLSSFSWATSACIFFSSSCACISIREGFDWPRLAFSRCRRSVASNFPLLFRLRLRLHLHFLFIFCMPSATGIVCGRPILLGCRSEQWALEPFCP